MLKGDGDFCRQGCQFLIVGFPAAMGAQALALIDRDDVEVQVEYRLPCWRLVELDETHAIGLCGDLDGPGDAEPAA